MDTQDYIRLADSLSYIGYGSHAWPSVLECHNIMMTWEAATGCQPSDNPDVFQRKLKYHLQKH